MSCSFSEDIRTYLQIFAKNIGVNINSYDSKIDGIVELIINRFNNENGLVHKTFEQHIHPSCKKCRLMYTEVGSTTKSKYKYCISSGVAKDVINCPKVFSSGRHIVDKLEDDSDIAAIRKRGKK